MSASVLDSLSSCISRLGLENVLSTTAIVQSYDANLDCLKCEGMAGDEQAVRVKLPNRSWVSGLGLCKALW